MVFTNETLTISILLNKDTIHHHKIEAANLLDSLDLCYHFLQVSNQLCTVVQRSSLVDVFHQYLLLFSEYSLHFYFK